MTKVILKPGRDRSIKKGHPWIFSGAIESMPSCPAGTIFPIYSHEGEFLAQGYFNPNNSLSGRIFSYDKRQVKEILLEKIKKALSIRHRLFDLKATNAFRLINGEGDGIPGLIIDVYKDYLVMQIHTSGVEKLRSFLVESLVQLFRPTGIYEKSTSAARNEEGLPPREELLYGEALETIEIIENGLKFLVSPVLGQKTGFFLDQRSMREKVEQLSHGKSVLSLFSYTGAFGIYAKRGGSTKVTSVDISASAIEFANRNSILNGFQGHHLIESDAFEYLEQNPIDQDLVLIDPPAFVKKRKSLDQAFKGYEKLNYLALSKMGPATILMTSSCSYYMDDALFQNAIFSAAQRAGRFVRIIGRHIQAPDHPISLAHPEGGYLKSLLLFVE